MKKKKEKYLCPRCGKPMKLNKEQSSKYNRYYEHCDLALAIG